MKTKISRKTGEYVLPSSLIRLHVSLDYVDSEDEEILRQYGGVKRGKTISRDILVPKNMPLRSLHFTLQRALGFQESHLHCFVLTDDGLVKVTNNSMENLLKLRGIIFRQDSEDGIDAFSPVYHGGSFKKWLKRQYTAPYKYGGDYLDDYHDFEMDDEKHLLTNVFPDDVYYLATKVHSKDEQDDKGDSRGLNTDVITPSQVNNLEGEGECIKWIRVNKRPWDSHYVRCSRDDPDAMSIKEIRLGDLDVFSGLTEIYERPIELIERLPLAHVLALSSDYLPFDDDGNMIHSVRGLKVPQVYTDEQIKDAMAKDRNILPKPFTKELIYIYDFGDNWHFRICGSKGCSDLIEEGVITKTKLQKSIDKALKEMHPVLIALDGDMLIEDCGNVEGFAKFLKRVNLDPEEVIKIHNDYEDPSEYTSYYSDFINDKDWNNVKVDDQYKDEEFDEEANSDEWFEDKEGEEHDIDENGMTRAQLLNWALFQGWHRNDSSNIDLL